MNTFDSSLLKLDEEIADALNEGQPVVALESNVICHGLPYPDNVKTAKRLKDVVREAGSVPAVIGIDGGCFLIGMTDEEIECFGESTRVPKVTSRDLPAVLSGGGKGATTVASSLMAAELATIPFFASAGIGGVHRGAELTMDISADLIQFTRSKVAVVCAGAKKILDLGLTMEFLETHSVPIISYMSDDFPAFYCRSSGFKSPHRMDSKGAISRAITLHWQLGSQNSILITCPIDEADAIEAEEADRVLRDALETAERCGIKGSRVTPYLMRELDRATEGRTATANVSVLVSTAKFAGKLAHTHASLVAA